MSVLPNGIDCVLGQINRVPEPSANFVIFWPILRRRLATNIDADLDCAFTASIAGTVMDVTAVGANNGIALRNGAVVSGPTVAAGTVISSQLTGATGGVGTYRVAPTQTAGAQLMAAGGATYTQQTEITFQVDVHSADLGSSSDMAQTISTMWRDAYATQLVAAINANVAPLYAGDPRQVPYINAEDQFETRWTVDLRLQANQTVAGAPAQFVTSADITLVDADVVIPPSGDSWSDGFSDGFGG